VVRFGLPLTASLLLALNLSGVAASAQNEPAQREPFVRLDLNGQPSLRFGSRIRADFMAKAQMNVEGVRPTYETDQGRFDLSRLRFGIEGEVTDDIEYQVEREFRGSVQERDAEYPWRDVWVNFRPLRDFQLRVGKFKVPFSLEAETGEADLDFVYRSRVADDLAPGRDVGATLHGRFGDLFGYNAGVFRNDGEKSESNVNMRGRSTVAGRFTSQPLRLLSLPGDWDHVEIGVAGVHSYVDEGLSSLRGRSVAGDVIFPHVYVKGRRLRLGTDVSWRPGPFSIQGEFIQIRERREGQSVRAEDLPEKISQGWYLAGTWAITGESKENGITPRNPFPSKGKGALEVALRYERIVFQSATREGLPFSSPRAPNLMRNGDHVWTAGLNWYLNRYVRIQVNGVRERILDEERSPVGGREIFHMGIVRLQFTL
jgi:phosphate-selective porin OprO/OprP